MDALDLEDAEDAAMMAENLKDTEVEEYKTRADIKEDEWYLCPKINDSQTSNRNISSTSKSDVDVPMSIVSFIIGPISLLYLTLVGTFFEPGYWFTEDKSSVELHWFAVACFSGLLGTLFLWIPLLTYLFVLL